MGEPWAYRSEVPARLGAPLAASTTSYRIDRLGLGVAPRALLVRLTLIDITGGLPGDGPAHDDKLIIRAVNDDAVCDERVIVFDGGPRDADKRTARWLYTNALGPVHAEGARQEWDYGKLPDSDTALWRQRAADLLAAVADERN
ncbi:hypothetical protein AB0C22_30730 [Micromonospora sp. NPDC048894]|uniref:hypothetical protein n=1 Tax=Micromonospora sp. NPDC048894 TaxID=3155493 RepID=UPI0033CFE4E0